MKKTILLAFFLSFVFVVTAQQYAGVTTRQADMFCIEYIDTRLFTIPAGTSVRITGERGDFYRIEFRGRNGFVDMQNIRRESRLPSPQWVTPQRYPSTQSGWEAFFLDRIQDLDPIEGIWNLSMTTRHDFWRQDGTGWDIGPIRNIPNHVRIAIYRYGNQFRSSIIGHTRAIPPLTFQNTAIIGAYLFEYYSRSFLRDIGINDGTIRPATSRGTAVLTGNGLLEFGVELQYRTESVNQRGRVVRATNWRTFQDFQLLKLLPSVEDFRRHQEQHQASSGTGFALSSDGHIATNYHVIEGARNIRVKGINGNFSRAYTARVVARDRNNDLAIIRIDDPNFTSLGRIPYTISAQEMNIGSSIFVLGYPLRSTMGDDVSITNGIVSSRSGFQDDPTSYQITAPIQPGNSGSPMFDSRGDVVGIVTAKHLGAQNVGYAVRTSFLMNLIRSMNSPPRLPVINAVSELSLEEQVRTLRRFVYIIEVDL